MAAASPAITRATQMHIAPRGQARPADRRYLERHLLILTGQPRHQRAVGLDRFAGRADEIRVPGTSARRTAGQARDRAGRHGCGNRVRRLGGSEMSGKVVVNRSMSLDGFIAGPGDAMDWIFDFVTPDAAWMTEIAAQTGAMLVGRRTEEVGS